MDGDMDIDRVQETLPGLEFKVYRLEKILKSYSRWHFNDSEILGVMLLAVTLELSGFHQTEIKIQAVSYRKALQCFGYVRDKGKIKDLIFQVKFRDGVTRNITLHKAGSAASGDQYESSFLQFLDSVGVAYDNR